eukprot:c11960_g1_i1.p1 GENE.c11960_g1_i1~~c11960_g1_i1.p1  ORF type:complete len:1246 (-),score=410.48 c11960_g1_i1:60-3728(-)
MVFIKQVIIQGFKSYKDQTVLPQFDPGHNVIVGRNGSGKSNFFSAIRFVLSDMFSNLRAEERQNLLHEGTGKGTVSGYVEIIFDNSDGRFPVDSEEVLLRRAIGLKKDEYFLNMKHVTKSDVINLLESAGFSRSNPYYIVQQGRVNALATMKDGDRLELLKEVAGTSVYDARREESLKIMQETETRRTKILEIIAYIDERLKELDAEKDELREYQRLDKERRCLEYAMYEIELNDTLKKVQQLEQQRIDGSRSSTEHHEKLRETQDQVNNTDKELRDTKQELDDLERERQQLEAERADDVKAKATAELTHAELQEVVLADNTQKQELEQTVSELDAHIETEKAKLQTAEGELIAAKQSEFELKTRLMQVQEEQQRLQSKQGRRSQFDSAQDRDKWINQTITQLEQTITSNNTQEASIQKNMAEIRQELAQMTAREKELAAMIQERKELIERSAKVLNDMANQRNTLHNSRRDMWKRDEELKKMGDKADDDLKRSETDLQTSINKATSVGLRAVRRLAQDHQIAGVYGPLLELFDCDDKVMTAVEVTAGNSLFDVVVDNSETASKLITLLNHERAGRVTFLPLSDLRTRPTSYPQSYDVFPMIERLKIHNPETRAAFEQIFGKTLICRTLEIASKIAREVDLDCVTLEGDRVNRKGAITGGFIDQRTSRIRCLKQIKSSRDVLDQCRQQRTDLDQERQELDQRISQVMSEMQKEETQRARNTDSVKTLSNELERIPAESRRLQTLQQEKQSNVVELQLETRRHRDRIASLQEELGTELAIDMSSQESRNLTHLTQEVRKIEKEISVLHATILELASRRSGIEIHLDSNLVKRRLECQSQLTELEANNREGELEQASAELDRISATVDQSLARQSSVAENIQKLQAKLQTLSAKIDQLKTREASVMSEMQESSKNIEKLVNKRNLLLDTKDDCMRKIRDLGPLSSDGKSYSGQTTAQLEKQKQKCMTQLKKFSHVNKKALDQYVNFTDQRDDLVKRKTDLDKGAKSIQELIQVLDQRKDEAIERTFKGVAKNFCQVFAELVPHGRADLVMMKKKKRAREASTSGMGMGDDDDDGDDDGDAGQAGDDGGDGSRIGQYKGVAIRASFTAAGDTHMLNQLSGGQKCLVALTLIFAIQRCDPAPFYLFDEIDANLDAAHRTAVATLIRKQSSQAQFITTTFKPEFLHAADRFYGVTYSNKISRIGIISQQDALDIIAEEAAKGEGAGQ